MGPPRGVEESPAADDKAENDDNDDDDTDDDRDIGGVVVGDAASPSCFTAATERCCSGFTNPGAAAAAAVAACFMGAVACEAEAEEAEEGDTPPRAPSSLAARASYSSGGMASSCSFRMIDRQPSNSLSWKPWFDTKRICITDLARPWTTCTPLPVRYSPGGVVDHSCY